MSVIINLETEARKKPKLQIRNSACPSHFICGVYHFSNPTQPFTSTQSQTTWKLNCPVTNKKSKNEISIHVVEIQSFFHPINSVPRFGLLLSLCSSMAAVAAAAGGVSIGVTNLQLHHLKQPTSPFLGKKLRFKHKSPYLWTVSVQNPRNVLVSALGGDLIHVVHNLFVGVGVGLPCTVMECGDIIYRSTLPKSNGLTLTIPGAILALGTLSYLWATPGVAPGFFDMFILAFVERIFRPTFRKVCQFLVSLFLQFSLMIYSWGQFWVVEVAER